MEKQREILDLPDAVKELVAECELTGNRTVFRRGERPVAILVSYDEYLALRETIALMNDADLRQRIESAEAEFGRNEILAPEDLADE